LLDADAIISLKHDRSQNNIDTISQHMI